MNATAETVLTATKEKVEVPASIEHNYRKLVEHMDADAKALPKDDAAEPVVTADNDNTAAAVAVAETHEASPEAPEAPVGPIDDTRAPLALPPVAAVKAPRKPFINWIAIQSGLKAFGNKVAITASRVTNLVGGAIIGFIVFSAYLLTQVIPGVLYFVGWMARNLSNAYLNGWRHNPLITEGKLTATSLKVVDTAPNPC